MASIKQYIILLSSMLSFVYTLYVIRNFVYFLSAPRRTAKIYTWVFNLLDDKSRMETAYGPMVFNTMYLILFVFQHSFMKSSMVKDFMQMIGLASAERAIYSLTSSLSLDYLMKNWLTTSSIVLWQVEVDSKKLWWLFILLHAFAWIIICGGTLIMDLPEIIGIKQAYYDMKSYGQPMAYKSLGLRHLLSHVRHPSFVGFAVILWSTNLMTLDRLLLAVLLTAYMYLAWSTDRNDLIYQKCQLQRKREELKCQ